MKNIHGTFIKATAVALLIILLTPTAAHLQGSSITVSIINPHTDRSVFPEITATVAVLDANGNLVPNLVADNFLILEDSRPVATKSAQIEGKRETPVSVCLAIDVNASMGNISGATGNPFITDAQDAATAYLNAGLIKSVDQTCIVTFSSKIDNLDTPASPKDMPFTLEQEQLKTFVGALAPDTDRGKPLYDGILKAIKVTASQIPGTRAVIVISEGKDERLAEDGTRILPGSDADASRPIQAAKDARIPVYTIALGNDPSQQYLKRLAEETGGQYQGAFMTDADSKVRSEKLGSLFNGIIERLKKQYTVKYNTFSSADGKEHVLQIRVKSVAGEAETRAAVVIPVIPTPWPVLVAQFAGVGVLVILALALVIAGARRAAPIIITTITRRRISYRPPPSPPPPPPPPAPEPETFKGGTQSIVQQDTEFGPAIRPMDTVSLQRPATSIAFLVMEQGDHSGKEFTIDPANTTIGRAGTNDIVVDDPMVGRQQAKIRLDGKDLYIYDLAATNPTFVNDKQVQGRCKLSENDRIRMGKTVFLFKQAKS